ncbi:MAG: hypothetical protein Q7T66_04865 [Herminiimonas sp.]|uniref:hypothetical protein n=1 Tax=Herminiimonas sp. TaxID=1926289 RepID=UPI002716EE50|nr:hypothetical protein [Herminiimonas sp.]MDO9419977.1 hypothetical protein [Herminiimonas sp.]
MSIEKTFLAAHLINQDDAASRARVDQHNIDAQQAVRISDQQNEIQRLSVELRNSQGTSNTERKLKEEVEAYEKLLCGPMLDIAKKNGKFKQTYEKQQELMAQWMLSQKAFKEIALQYGKKLGISPDEVLKEFDVVQENLLNNKAEFEKVDAQLINDLQSSKRRESDDAEKKRLDDEHFDSILKKHAVKPS